MAQRNWLLAHLRRMNTRHGHWFTECKSHFMNSCVVTRLGSALLNCWLRNGRSTNQQRLSALVDKDRFAAMTTKVRMGGGNGELMAIYT